MAQPGCTTTRSPIKLLVIEALALMVHWRPMRTLGPIAAPALITVPVPISARGPVTAPGSTVTPRSEEHTYELLSLTNLVCRLLLEKKKQVYEKAIAEARTVLNVPLYESSPTRSDSDDDSSASP